MSCSFLDGAEPHELRRLRVFVASVVKIRGSKEEVETAVFIIGT